MAQTYAWARTPCRILESGVGRKNDDKPYVFQVRYRYEFGGREHEGATYKPTYSGSSQISDVERLMDRYPPGSDAVCRVDPKAPHRSTLVRASPWVVFLIFLPLVFVAVGGGGLYAMWRGGRTEEAPPHRKSLSKRAVSPQKAAGCLAAFFGIFLVAGVGTSLFFVVPALRIVRARSWSAVPCTVISSDVRSHRGDDSTTYSVHVLYEYEVGGRTYRSSRYQFLGGSSGGYEAKARVVEAHPAGARVTCWVNPYDPHDAVLNRSFGREYVVALVPVVFAIAGGGGIYFALRNFRREKAKAAALGAGFAFAPDDRADAGPVALKSMGPVGKFVTTLLVTLFWNGIVSVFLWQMFKQWRGGNRPFGLTCFLVPFVLVGLALVVATVANLLATFNPRVGVTLSSRAIPLGETANLEWRFRGGASRVTRVDVHVEGREEATYSSGDSTHTDRSVFAKLPVFNAGGPGAQSGTATIAIPADTMHSFSASNNKIVWTLKLRGEIPNWPDVTQDYELDVRPKRT